jgi:hypothetical protein
MAEDKNAYKMKVTMIVTYVSARVTGGGDSEVLNK